MTVRIGKAASLHSFDAFIAVDWTGATDPAAVRRAIAVAICEPGANTPRLIEPTEGWTRRGVLDWLTGQASQYRILVGFDFGFAFPFVDRGAYLPGIPEVGGDFRAMLDFVEARAGDGDDLGVGSLFDDGQVARHFLMPGMTDRSGFERRFRVAEVLSKGRGFGQSQSMFHLIGPNQVGKASISGMRLLKRADNFAIWPFDNDYTERSVFVELYTGLCITSALGTQRKIRDAADCVEALRALGVVAPDLSEGPISDHASDALVSAAALRRFASSEDFWYPSAMSDKVRRTEGWIFGVV